MLTPRLIPLLLFRGEGLWKGVGFKDHKYVGDVMNAVRIFNARQADELMLLDIDASNEGRAIRAELVERVSRECLMPLAVGGGVGDAGTARALLNAGAEKVVVNSLAHDDPQVVSDIAASFGSQSVVAAIDYAFVDGKPRVFSRNAGRVLAQGPVEAAERMAEAGAGEILLTSIERDGAQTGYDLETVGAVAAAVTLPVIVGGGAGSLAHMVEAHRHGAAAMAAGSLFVFHGRRRAVLVNYPERTDIEAAFA